MERITPSFRQAITKNELKKWINFYSSHASVRRFCCFQSDRVIFEVRAKKGHVFNINGCRFQSVFGNKKGVVDATFTMNREGLKEVLNSIEYFERFPKDKEKLGFPDIKLKI